MTQVSWRSVTPQYEQFRALFEQYDALTSTTFLATQPRLRQAIEYFIPPQSLSRFLLINAPDNSIYQQVIKDSLVEVLTTTTSEKAPTKPIVVSDSLDINVIFGQYQCDNDGNILHRTIGLLEQAQNGYLIISAQFILSNPRYWFALKSAILGKPTSAINVNSKMLPRNNTISIYDVKLIIVGDRFQLSDIDELDSEMNTSLSMFAEVEQELKLSDIQLPCYLSYLKGICEQYNFPSFTPSALVQLLTIGARKMEDQHRMTLCPIWHAGLISSASLLTQKIPSITQSNTSKIDACHLKTVMADRKYQSAYIATRALEDIINGQQLIQTEGQQVGQINGLSVVEVSGHPFSYGEPVRISCVLHQGDGDVNDVERKIELGGNLHAKGMMIMQAFLMHVLDLNEALPYSASIVFEQSYSEIDGDSASLAGLCAYISALADCPIDQQIAVTGAVDQFGRVQAVGGLNEKIEGFFYICKQRGLTGKQGVIIPSSNLHNLILPEEICESIKLQQFHIWTVDSVEQTLAMLMNKPFADENEDDAILNRIVQRIEMTHAQNSSELTCWERIKLFFKPN